jgi:hypothetical protein
MHGIGIGQAGKETKKKRAWLLTYEGCIVLDAVMHVDVREVEVPGGVGAVEDPGDEARDVEAERGRKVVRRADLGRQLAEGDVAPVVGEETCIVSERTDVGLSMSVSGVEGDDDDDDDDGEITRWMGTDRGSPSR